MGNNNQGYRINPVTGQQVDIQGFPIRNNRPVAQPKQTSPINNLIQQAMSAQPNVPTLAQLFPYMNYGATNMNNLGGLLGMTGQFGAGRFLGGNTMGNTGMTSNAMNTM